MSEDNSQPTYPPALFNEYTIAFEGSSLACILYGIYLFIVGFNLVLLRKKKYHILLTYSIVQLVLTTLYFAISLYIAPVQSLGIFNIVGSYGLDELSPWPSVIVDTLFILNTWTSDAFLLYRCHVVYMGNAYVLALPVMLYIATVGSSLAWLVVSSIPGAVYSTHAVQITGICYWSLSVAMNVCATCIISAKLLTHQYAIDKAVGVHQGAFYLGYMAMTLESALLYTVFVIMALVVFALNSPFENMFFPMLGTVQAIAPALIIYRISCGLAFGINQCGSSTVGTLRFASSLRPRAIRPVRQDVSDGSDTMQASLEDSSKIEQDDTNSFFIQEFKEAV